MDRLFDRAFNKAHGTATAVMGTAAATAEQQQKQQQKSREAMLRECNTPMTSEDVVERIGLAFKDNDYFRLLQLPGPELNELSRAVWPVSSSDLSKAYRKLSLLVHPDKAPGPEARQAFEQLKQAYNELRDSDKLAARLRDAEPALQKAADRAAAAASLTDKVGLNAAAEERKAKLRQQEAKDFQAEIQKQMQQRAAQAALRKQRAQASRYRREDNSSGEEASDDEGNRKQQQQQRQDKHGGSGGGRSKGKAAARQQQESKSGSDGDESKDEIRRKEIAKRKKPRFM